MIDDSSGIPVVQARFDWQFAETVRAARHIMLRRTSKRWLRHARSALVVVLVIGLVLIALGAATGGRTDVLIILPFLLLVLLWIALLTGWLAPFAVWQLRRNNPQIVKGQEHLISAQGYQTTCGAATSRMAWDGLIRVVETKEFFLAYPLRNAAYYLPKRALSNDDIRALRELFRLHLADRSELLAV